MERERERKMLNKVRIADETGGVTDPVASSSSFSIFFLPYLLFLGKKKIIVSSFTSHSGS